MKSDHLRDVDSAVIVRRGMKMHLLQESSLQTSICQVIGLDYRHSGDIKVNIGNFQHPFEFKFVHDTSKATAQRVHKNSIE